MTGPPVREPADALAGAHAVGWATVELDRAAVELAPLLRAGSTFRQAPSSAILGARCLVGDARGPGAPLIVLLEPSTEGRLTGALARYGEGWVATWFHAAHHEIDGPGSIGPLGREWLDRGSSAASRSDAAGGAAGGMPAPGPYRLLLQPVTIEA